MNVLAPLRRTIHVLGHVAVRSLELLSVLLANVLLTRGNVSCVVLLHLQASDLATNITVLSLSVESTSNLLLRIENVRRSQPLVG